MFRSRKKAVKESRAALAEFLSQPQDGSPQDQRPTTPSAPRPAAAEEDVRLRAYLKWEAAGRPPSDGVAFWLDAEREAGGV